MKLNADLDLRVVLHTPDIAWVASPAHGVNRRMLDRIGDEVAVATTIVQYLPQTQFHSHVHGGGEEILVLAGQFSDEYGDYPAGTYLRNPPGSAHTPRPEEGCTIFVKLRQFLAGDTQRLRIDSRSATWVSGATPGVALLPLHEHGGILTLLQRWSPHTALPARLHPHGLELFVIEGCLHDELGRYPAGTWLRSPRGSTQTPFTLAEGALVYVKTGHIGAPFFPGS